jgi:hypothetical protein
MAGIKVLMANPQDDQNNNHSVSSHSTSATSSRKWMNKMFPTRNKSTSHMMTMNQNSQNKVMMTDSSSSKPLDKSNDGEKRRMQPSQLQQASQQSQQPHIAQQQERAQQPHDDSTKKDHRPLWEHSESNSHTSSSTMDPSSAGDAVEGYHISTRITTSTQNVIASLHQRVTTVTAVGGSVQTNPNQATTTATRTNSTMSSSGGGGTANSSTNSSSSRRVGAKDLILGGGGDSANQQTKMDLSSSSFWDRLSSYASMTNHKTTTTPSVAMSTGQEYDNDTSKASPPIPASTMSHQEEPVAIPFFSCLMCTTPLDGSSGCIPLSEAFGCGVFSSYTTSTTTSSNSPTTRDEIIDDQIVDHKKDTNKEKDDGKNKSLISAPYSNISSSTSPNRIRLNHSTVTASTSAAVKVIPQQPQPSILHTLSDQANNHIRNDPMEVSSNHEVSMTLSAESSSPKRIAATTVMDYQKQRRQIENENHEQRIIKDDDKADTEQQEVLLESKLSEGHLASSNNNDRSNTNNTLNNNVINIIQNSNNNNSIDINDNDNNNNNNKGNLKKSKYSNSHDHRRQQQPQPQQPVAHDRVEEMEKEKVSATVAAPFALLTLRPEEMYAMERNVSELTMRSSYASSMNTNPFHHSNDKNSNNNNNNPSNNISSNNNKNVNQNASTTNNNPENRRMAYYAVGQHFHLQQRGSIQNKTGGNRRCYFTGKLILGGAPFYSGCVQQGLRTLVVFCLPSALNLPEQDVINKYRREHIVNHSHSTNQHNHINNKGQQQHLAFPSLVKSATSGSQSVASRNSGVNSMTNRRMMPTFRLMDMSNNSGGGGGNYAKNGGRRLSRKAFGGGGGSVATGSQYSQSQITNSSRISRFTMTGGGGGGSYHTNNDERTIGTSINSIESDLDPNWNIDNHFLLQVLPPAGPIILQKMSTMYRDQFETLPVQVRDSTRWKLYIKFCFFSGLPISQDELHYKIRDDIADSVYYGEEIVLSHEVMEAAIGASSAELLTLPNTNVMKYIKRHYVQQCAKLGSDQRIFQRASWERISPEV